MSARPDSTNNFLDRFISRIGGEGQLRILDVGCGNGETALRLARLGHQVLGISNLDSDVDFANRLARRENNGNCMFENVDARDLSAKFGKEFFGAVLISDMLHLVDKNESNSILTTAKDLTHPTGFNAIHGYLVDPAKSTSRPNMERMFHPGELSRTYQSDPEWEVMDSSEDVFAAHLFNGDELVSSHASLIARKQPCPRGRG